MVCNKFIRKSHFLAITDQIRVSNPVGTIFPGANPMGHDRKNCTLIRPFSQALKNIPQTVQIYGSRAEGKTQKENPRDGAIAPLYRSN